MYLRIGSIVLLALTAGCESRFAEVSGRVTMDGKPLEQVKVVFQPIASGGNKNPGRGSQAMTDADGKYRLRVSGAGDGAVIGKHKVMIIAPLPDPARGETGPRIPKVNIPAHGTLTFEVPPGGTDEANFELKSP